MHYVFDLWVEQWRKRGALGVPPWALVRASALSPITTKMVGMVMQSAYLFPGTVAENLSYGPRQHGEELPASKIDNLLEQVGLEGFAHRDVSHLSGGEAQRVSLARTLANKPEVLLFSSVIGRFCY